MDGLNKVQDLRIENGEQKSERIEYIFGGKATTGNESWSGDPKWQETKLGFYIVSN